MKGIPKLKKLSNKELIESVFIQIEELGFHVKDKEYGDTYFLFKGNEDSICQFHIKEIPRISICLLVSR